MRRAGDTLISIRSQTRRSRSGSATPSISCRLSPGSAWTLESGLGGLLYLLNLALQLDLYGDFTRPGEPGIALSPWDLVELLGLRLLGERPDDPVWELLASLAGRTPGTPPGRDFSPRRYGASRPTGSSRWT